MIPRHKGKVKECRTIASLTSFPARIPTIHIVIETILNQTVLPDKIVLYLADEQFPGRDLPASLTNLAQDDSIFEIRWCPRDIRSFKKLIPALTEFPDDIIITLDDDILYPPNIIEHLVKKHRRYPKAVCGCRVLRVGAKNKKVNKHRTWKIYRGIRPYYLGMWPRLNNLAASGAGTLFPPHCLHPDILREDIFMELCPTTDEIWFWAMAVRNGTKTAPAASAYGLKLVSGSQEEALWQVNTKGEFLNDVSMGKILEAYPEVKACIL